VTEAELERARAAYAARAGVDHPYRWDNPGYVAYIQRLERDLLRALADADVAIAGARILDVGCGTGYLLERLREFGAGESHGIDLVEDRIASGRERHPALHLQVGNAAELPFGDGAFDLVTQFTCLSSILDADVRAAAAREMRRVARRGGAVAACVWDYAEGMTMLRAFWDAARSLDAAAPDEGAEMEYCREGELGTLWGAAGLADVEDGALVVEADYEDFDDYWWPFTTGVAPSGAYCAALDPERREELRDAVWRRLGKPTGSFRLTARAWYAVGRA
jgi:SAM-dependent methyltransferase